jgi:hypothetical protein
MRVGLMVVSVLSSAGCSLYFGEGQTGTPDAMTSVPDAPSSSDLPLAFWLSTRSSAARASRWVRAILIYLRRDIDVGPEVHGGDGLRRRHDNGHYFEIAR